MLRFTTIALLLLSPALASAQCLNAASIEGGITVEYGSGNLSYLERDQDGMLLDSYVNQDDMLLEAYVEKGYAQETILFRSYNGIFNAGQVLHTRDSWEALENKSITYDFDIPLAASLVVGDRGNGIRTTTDAAYGPTTDTFGWSVYASEPLVVGDCSYEAVRVFTTMFYPRNGKVDIREIKYLPELGFGIQIGNSDKAFSAANAEIVSLSPS